MSEQRKIDRLCVFCGSSPGHDPVYRRAAAELGRRIAADGRSLVYGGGNVGLMGVLADAAMADGAEVVGVIPEALHEREVAHHGLTRLEVVANMHERKQRMHDLSDAFVALPGGFGTLEEMLETVTWIQLGLHAKPCGLLNVGGYYDPLLEMLDRATEAGFVHSEHRRLLVAESDAGLLLERFESYRAPERGKWLTEKDV